MNEVAPEGQVWVCLACGKMSKDKYGNQQISRGWDASCMLNSELFKETELVIENNRVTKLGSQIMAKKKEVKTSGVNLEGLNLEQLQTLQGEIIGRREVILENKRQADLSELKQAGRLQEFKVLAKEFQKEIKRLTKGSQFEIVLPIRFTMKGEPYSEFVDWLEWEDTQLTDFVSFSFSAKLAGNAQALNLTKNQHEILDQLVKVYVEDACDDILELTPQNIRDELNDFMTRFIAFKAELRKFSLTGKDLGL